MVDKLIAFNNNPSVNKELNPFFNSLQSFNQNQLEHLLLQYSLFPKNIISILISAAYNLSYFGYEKLSEELIQNINEELGRYTDETLLVIPKPHFTILRKGFFEGLGIEINNTNPSESTFEFLDKLKSSVDVTNIHKALGSVFAIESSAIPELEIIIELVKRLFDLSGKEMPQYLINFFNYHIDEIEIGHRDRFYHLCSKHLKSNETKKDFELGFSNVMKIMDKWWLELYEEVKASEKKPAENNAYKK